LRLLFVTIRNFSFGGPRRLSQQQDSDDLLFDRPVPRAHMHLREQYDQQYVRLQDEQEAHESADRPTSAGAHGYPSDWRTSERFRRWSVAFHWLNF
jgi:hypothetical protein